MSLTKTHAPRKCDYRRVQMSGPYYLVVGQIPARAYAGYSVGSDNPHLSISQATSVSFLFSITRESITSTPNYANWSFLVTEAS